MICYNKITMHNFWSYSHAEVNLRDRGFCLVTGENRSKGDNAKSNGAGKSAIWSAICFALTGETIQGVKSGLKNSCNDEEDAYVELSFDFDGDSYRVRRDIAPKSDLKIERNGADMSGKGIRESEAKLAELLPDLTQDQISSTAIIGQGMPNRFSAHKPSGRKELLEKLTKSDFMIEDIKARIAARQSYLAAKLREVEDRLVALTAKKASAEAGLASLKAADAADAKPDFAAWIMEADGMMAKALAKGRQAQDAAKAAEAEADAISAKLNAAAAEKAGASARLLESYNAKVSPLSGQKLVIETKIRALDSEILKLMANPTVCPTCGQPIPNAEHYRQEASRREADRSKLAEELAAVSAEIAKADKAQAGYKAGISAEYDARISAANAELAACRSKLSALRRDEMSQAQAYGDAKAKKAALEAKAESWDRECAARKAAIASAESQIAGLGSEIADASTSRESHLEHLAAVKQLETLTKRDFRGYILSDVIRFLDAKAKEYSEIVFGHRDLSVYLDGNDLDISWRGRMFDNMSGGEKTRVDLIIQFAIRDLLATYMGLSSNILVLDEVTDFLDGRSCDAVMSMISSRLRDVESVFIVSHHAESLSIPVDSELRVVKGEDGVSGIA